MTHKNRAVVASGAGAQGREAVEGRATGNVGEGHDEQTGVRVTREAGLPSRLDLMLARAQVVIAHMAPADPRARLLQVAVLRRDEILLEALLRRLDSAPPVRGFPSPTR